LLPEFGFTENLFDFDWFYFEKLPAGESGIVDVASRSAPEELHEAAKLGPWDDRPACKAWLNYCCPKMRIKKEVCKLKKYQKRSTDGHWEIQSNLIDNGTTRCDRKTHRG